MPLAQEPVRNLVEARMRLADGGEVDPLLVQALEREHELCRAAYEWPHPFAEGRLRETMFRGADYRMFWRALRAVFERLGADKITGASIVAHLPIAGPGRFTDQGSETLDVWVARFVAHPPQPLEYALDVLASDKITEHDLRRFESETRKLNDRIGTDPPDRLFGEYITAATRIAREAPPNWHVTSVRELASQYADPARDVPIVPSGISAIDMASGGGPGRGHLVVIGGGTNHGKSFAAEELLHRHHELKQKMLYISTEDDKDLVMCRLIARRCDPPQRPVWVQRPPDARSRSQAQGYSHEAIRRACAEVDNSTCLFVYAKAKAKIGAVLDAMRNHRNNHGVVAVCVDYLQAITTNDAGTAHHRPDPVRDTSAHLSELKRTAREIGVSLYVMSQYARDAYRDGEEPTIHACKYAGDIENEAEIMVLFWRSADGQLMAKIPKSKWVETTAPRFLIRRNRITGCFESWEEDFTYGQGGSGQGAGGAGPGRTSGRPGQRNGFGKRRQL